MIKILVISFSVIQMVCCAPNVSYCDKDDDFVTVFTLDYVSYAIKGMYGNYIAFRTFVGQTFAQGEPIEMYGIYTRTLNFSFDKIETGFMITKTPNCSAGDPNCDEITKLEGKAFLMGVEKYSTEHKYKTFEFAYIKTDDVFPLLSIPNGSLPFGIPLEGLIDNTISKLWPGTYAHDFRYKHSTYDERSFTIVHLIYTNGSLVLYTYSLQDMSGSFNYDKHVLSNSDQFHGFIYMLSNPSDDPKNRADPITIYALHGLTSDKPDSLLELEMSFNLTTTVSMSLEEINGCSLPTTTTQPEDQTSETMTKLTDEDGMQSMTTEKDSTGDYSTIFGDDSNGDDYGQNSELYSDDGLTHTVMPTNPMPTSKAEKSSFFLLIMAVVILLIVVIALVLLTCYLRQRKSEEKDETKGTAASVAKPPPRHSKGQSKKSKTGGEVSVRSEISGTAARPSGSSTKLSTTGSINNRSDEEIV